MPRLPRTIWVYWVTSSVNHEDTLAPSAVFFRLSLRTIAGFVPAFYDMSHLQHIRIAQFPRDWGQRRAPASGNGTDAKSEAKTPRNSLEFAGSRGHRVAQKWRSAVPPRRGVHARGWPLRLSDRPSRES